MNNDISFKLIEKYSISGPRYTSYPTALELSASFDSQKWFESLSKLDTRNALSLYVHIPFCPSLCYFCACNKVITKRQDKIEEYLFTLKKEISQYGDLLGQKHSIVQLHFGGGSPSYLSGDQFSSLIEHIYSVFPNVHHKAELSIEVDPRTTDFKKMTLYRDCGLNRISFGVQDFDSDVQELINRKQSYEMTEGLISGAARLGFSGSNIDLIYGLPGQTLHSFYQTIEKIRLLAPDRIALYGYAHVPWVKKAQHTFASSHLPTSQERIALFTLAQRSLQEMGYEHIGMDHFAFPTDDLSLARHSGTLKRNFMGYTTQPADTLIGFGMSAISSSPHMIVQNQKELSRYNVAVLQSIIERGVTLTEDDQMRAEIIQMLFCTGIVKINVIEERWNISFWEYFFDSTSSLKELENDGIVLCSPERIALTERGGYFVRNVAMIFDTYLSKYKENSARVFSQAV